MDDVPLAAALAIAEAASTDVDAASAPTQMIDADPGVVSAAAAGAAGTDMDPSTASAAPAVPPRDVLAWVTRSPDLLAAVVIALVLATLVVPPLAVLVVWPFLTVVPGWLLAARVAPGLSAPGRLGIGIVTSVFVASHLVNAVADIAGFGPRTIILCAVVLMAASWILARRPLPHLAAPPVVSRQTVGAALRRDCVAWALAAGVAGAILLILGLSAWHQTPAGWVSGGWNWSDFLVHVAIGNSIIHGNFPPQVPYFVGAPLSYHWFADFHGAILAAVARISIIPVFIVSSAAMAGTLALLVWELARQLTRNRRVAAIAVILVCFGGGLGWLRLVLDLAHGQGSLIDLVTKNPYDNSWAGDWPFFRIASVLGTGLLPHRATTFGLPGLVASVVLVHGSLGRRPAGMLLAGLLAALLAPFQFFFFPATYLIVLLMVVARRAWRRRNVWRDAALFLAPIALALPFVVGPALRQGERGAFRFVLGWSEARIGDGPLAVLFFYVTNLGLPVLLALLAIIQPGRFPARRFLAIWLLALFVVPNVVVVSSVEFDMNKYFQVLWVAAAILAAWLIARWPRPLLVAVLAISVLSPTLVALWHVRNQSIALTPDQEVTGRWIEVNTPSRAIFVTDAWINSPVDLAGRLRLTGFGPYVANLGYNPDVRAKDVHSVYCDGPVAARAVMARYGASYVLSSGGLLDCGSHQPTDFDASPLFEMVFRDGGTAVWRLIP